MKHILVYESFNPISWVKSKVSNVFIERLCKKYDIKNYTINPDGSVDVAGDVEFSVMHDSGEKRIKLGKLPIKFGRVTGTFYCSEHDLTSLKGAPNYVGGYFYCNGNKLTSLEGGPSFVSGNYSCFNNKLITLEGMPEQVGKIDFSNNPVYVISKLFNNQKDFIDSLDWKYLKGNSIIKYRFEEACAEFGIAVPESIEGYKYI